MKGLFCTNEIYAEDFKLILKKCAFFVFLFLFLLFFTAQVVAISQSGSIKIFAVTEDGKGMAADLVVNANPGSGKVAFVTSNSLVGKDTQTTGNVALQIAQKKTNVKVNNTDFIFDIKANASEVDGPSAGAAMALLLYSMLSETPLNSKVGLTGTISPDGSIGVVGGVGHKAKAASEAGIKLFMIPLGEALADVGEGIDSRTVNLLEYGPNELGMKIVEVSNIDQVIKYAYSNIDEIIVDTNISAHLFLPKPIKYNSILAPMESISAKYIRDAKQYIEETRNALQSSSLPESDLVELYQRFGFTKRNIEMAQRFLDQNYLYSSANYAFNSRVLAGTIKEIAQNPSIMSRESMLLKSKVYSLKNELDSLKKMANFIPLDDFEWVIGAQQRLAYAENALNKASSVFSSEVSVERVDADLPFRKESLFNSIYDYVSAQAWMSIAKDFLEHGKKSTKKKIPVYTEEYMTWVKSKINYVENLISDSNASEEVIEEAKRRLDSSKISFDNNCLFAAVYDAHFAEALINSKKKRANYELDDIYLQVEKDINLEMNSDSVWASLFFDHAKFYYENAQFNRKLGREAEGANAIQTSFDLIYLSNELSKARDSVEEYLLLVQMQDYIDDDSQTLLEVNYNKRYTFDDYFLVFIIIMMMLILIILMTGIAINARKRKFCSISRKEQLRMVLSNLDQALKEKKISKSEYFFMKRKYDDEFLEDHKLRDSVGKPKLKLEIDDLVLKEKALQRGLKDLERYYDAGVIIGADYERHREKVLRELNDLATEIRKIKNEISITPEEKEQIQLGNTSQIETIPKEVRTKWVAKGFKRKKDKKTNQIKGTEEKVDEEIKEELREKKRRKEILAKLNRKNKN